MFLHEHPAGASSWGLEQIKELQAEEGVLTVVGDQCAYGLKTWSADGKTMMPARKKTRFLTNSVAVAMELSGKCDGKHEHSQLLNGTAKQAERYPLPLVRRVLKAIRNGLRRCRGTSLSAVEVGTHIDEDPPEPKFMLDHLNDSRIYDQYTGVELDGQKVGALRRGSLTS